MLQLLVEVDEEVVDDDLEYMLEVDDEVLDIILKIKQLP